MPIQDPKHYDDVLEIQNLLNRIEDVKRDLEHSLAHNRYGICPKASHYVEECIANRILPADTLLAGTYNRPYNPLRRLQELANNEPYDPFVDPKTLRLGDRIEVTKTYSAVSIFTYIGEIVALDGIWLTIRDTKNNNATFDIGYSHNKWRLLHRPKPELKIGDRISGPDVFTMPIGSVVRSINMVNGYEWVVMESNGTRLVRGLRDSFRTHYNLSVSSRYNIVRIGF